MSASLSARNVVHRFGNVVALDGVSLDVAAGQATAIVGESGSGKTTLLRCFNRLVEPDAGEILVDNRDVRLQHPVDLRRSIGYVQQHGGLLPHWRVLRNVELVPVLRGMDDANAAAARALDLVGLPAADFGSRFPHELSGGQRQRIGIARALYNDPSVLILDEGTSALDTETENYIMQSVALLKGKLTIILIAHRYTTLHFCDMVYKLQGGKMVSKGKLEELI